MLRLWREGQVVLPKLSGLRQLSIVGAGEESEGLLLQLATLQQLTRLTYIGRVDGADVRTFFGSEVRVYGAHLADIEACTLQLVLLLRNECVLFALLPHRA